MLQISKFDQGAITKMSKVTIVCNENLELLSELFWSSKGLISLDGYKTLVLSLCVIKQNDYSGCTIKKDIEFLYYLVFKQQAY